MGPQDQAHQIAERLKVARTLADLSLREVSAELDVSESSVHRWEKAEALPPADKLKKLCLLYSVSADYLLAIEEHPTGLPIRRWVVDRDTVTAILNARRVGNLRNHTDGDGKLLPWAAEIPASPGVLTGQEMEHLQRKIASKLAELRAKTDESVS